RINPDQQPRLSMTVSGDGYNSHLDDQTLREIRDQKKALETAEITVNGVPIVIHEYSDMLPAENLSGPMMNRGIFMQNRSSMYGRSDTGYDDLADFYKKEIVTRDGYVEKAET